jgi:hypothetical protein
MPQVGFEPKILVFERAKTVDALHRAATVIWTFIVTPAGNSVFIRQRSTYCDNAFYTEENFLLFNMWTSILLQMCAGSFLNVIGETHGNGSLFTRDVDSLKPKGAPAKQGVPSRPRVSDETAQHVTRGSPL